LTVTKELKRFSLSLRRLQGILVLLGIIKSQIPKEREVVEVDKIAIEVSRIHKLDGSGATKAFCDITIGDMFVIKGLRIIEGEKGLFISMPREEGRDGKWYNTVIPLNREVKDEIEKIVLEAYGC